eukprot:5353786-Prymnesium_polylepis.1
MDAGNERLHFAAWSRDLAMDATGKSRMVALQHGGTKFKEVSGLTAAHKAAAYGRADVMRHLEAFGADLRAKTTNGRQPVHSAITRYATTAHVEVLKFLREREVDLRATDTDGWTPAHIAAYLGKLQVLGYLALVDIIDMDALRSSTTVLLNRSLLTGKLIDFAQQGVGHAQDRVRCARFLEALERLGGRMAALDALVETFRPNIGPTEAEHLFGEGYITAAAVKDLSLGELKSVTRLESVPALKAIKDVAKRE